jgi:uncharacterized protein (TIGR00725 family)
MKKLISVIGSDKSDKNLSKYALDVAEEIGRLIAMNNAILICGGRGGIMEAACKGAKKKGGITVGILPKTREEANKYVDIPIITGLGNLRNSLVVNTSDAVIAIAGRSGTLNEISYSILYQKPLILIRGTGGIVDLFCKGKEFTDEIINYYTVDSAKEAIKKIFKIN